MYKELIVYVKHIGGGVVTAVMSEVNHSCQRSANKKMLSATVLSVNQEINKTGALPHGITEVAISAKLEHISCMYWELQKKGVGWLSLSI